MAKVDDNTLCDQGPIAFRFATDANGRSIAKEFFDGLSVSDQRKILSIAVRIGQGVVLHHTKFKPLRDEIYEIKIFGIRMPCFRDGDTWFITHGFPKKADATRPAEIDKAVRIRREHFERKAAVKRRARARQ